MDNRRLKKVGTLLKETLSDIIAREGVSIYGSKCLVSVSNVVVTPDLSVARFYFSIFNANDAEEVLLLIKKHSSKIRGLIGNATRHQLRKIPELEFFIDDTMEQAFRINQLMDEIQKEREAIENLKNNSKESKN